MATIHLAIVQVPIPRVPGPWAIIPPTPRVPIVPTLLRLVLGVLLVLVGFQTFAS